MLAAVTVLSPVFVRDEHPMGKLNAALAHKGCPGAARICPIFHSLSIEECTKSDFREQYDLQSWDSFGLTAPKPEPEVLDGYAKDIQELCRVTNLHLVCCLVQQCSLQALSARPLPSLNNAL